MVGGVRTKPGWMTGETWIRMGLIGRNGSDMTRVKGCFPYLDSYHGLDTFLSASPEHVGQSIADVDVNRGMSVVGFYLPVRGLGLSATSATRTERCVAPHTVSLW